MSRRERRTRKEKKSSDGSSVRKVMHVLGGSFLAKEKFAKQFPFMVVVTVMLMVLITNTYIAEEKTREIARNTKLLNDLQVEYVQLKSSIMQASKQSVLSRRLTNLGIKDPTEPVKRIDITEEQENEEERR